MFKSVFNILGLIVAGLFFGGNAYSQYPAAPTDNFANLPGGFNDPVSGGLDSVCPSIAGNFSTDTFRVSVNTDDLSGEIWFEWVVYGGSVIDDNGTTVNPSDNDASPTSYNTVPYFYIDNDNYTSGAYAFIVVQWHTADVDNAWVAVRQRNEWGCYNGLWSVYTNDIYNKKPVFDNFPTDITIAFDNRLNFILPLPAASDADNCPLGLSYSYVIDRPDPLSDLIGNGDLASRTLSPDSLGVGDNEVTWTISDGMKQVDSSYTITVDPRPLITRVAWIDPLCAGAGNGSLFVSDTLAYTFDSPLQYSLNGGEYTPARHYGGLLAGNDTLRARVSYDVDIDFDGDTDHYDQLSPKYGATLRDPAAKAVDAVPLQTDAVNVLAVNPECASSSDGYIWVNPNAMTPQNRSLLFNGTSDHIRLNKFYNTELSELTVAAWIKVPNALLTSDAVIVSFNNARHFQLKVTVSGASSGKSYVRFETVTPGGITENLQHDFKINDGKWHLVVATFNNGVKRIYIDGLPNSTTSAFTTLGTNTAASYGAIGARIASSAFGAAPEGDYFRGNMTDVGIWESFVDSAGVVDIMKSGIASAGPSAYWVLNDLPSIISAGNADVFTDVGNVINQNEWGRMYGGSIADNNAPVLYSWDPDDFPDTELEDIPSGSYELKVTDIQGCSSSADSATYTLTNNDQSPPLILVNMALLSTTADHTRATQSTNGTAGTCGTAYAYFAADGNLDNDPDNCSVSSTEDRTDQWWQINLGSIQNIRQVRVFHASNGAPENFYVMISQSPINSLGDTARTSPLSQKVTFQHYTGTPPDVQVFTFANNNSQYLRINAVGNGALLLAEVEALVPREGTYTRNLYLGSDDCSYIVGDLEGSVDPVAFDNCGVIDTIYHNQSGMLSDSSLVGMELNLGTTPVVWTVIDDSPDTTLLTINYTLIDTIRPVFTEPYNNFRDTVTWCDVADGNTSIYKIPKPNTTDNYNCIEGGVPNYHISRLMLRIDGVERYTWHGNEYDPLDDADSVLINKNYLAEGVDHRFVWEVTDQSNNFRRDTFYVYVQKKPQIIELKSADVSCYDLVNKDGIINIFNISAESGEAVTYYLRNSTDTIYQTNSLFNTLEADTFRAWIEVDGCPSAEYYNSSPIIIREPVHINPAIDIIPVRCYGDSGDVNIYLPTTKQLLHLLGGANNVITVANYPALELGNSGTVEAMIYLDTLSTALANSNAGIVNYISGANSYGLRIINGELALVVGGDTLVAPAGSIEERRWIHVAGTWSATETAIYVDHTQVITGDPASNSAAGGMLYIGCLGSDPEENNLHGFVRFARVWGSALTRAQLYTNYRFASPINYGNSLVANFPINVNQGTQLQNTAHVTTATLLTANAVWQAYAYHWEGQTTPHISRTESLLDAPAQSYRYEIHAPYSCSYDSTIVLQMTDNKPPVLSFYNENRTVNLTGILQRLTGQTTSTVWIDPDVVNVTGDCSYTAQGNEFDPVVDDDGCPGTVVSWALPDSSEYGTSLNGRAFTDTTVVNWYAVDGTGLNDVSKTITYLVRDNEAPQLTYRDSIVLAMDGLCSYQVPDSVTFVPTWTDNCTTGGRLWNNYPGGGFTNNLYHVNIPVGEHDIRWIYRDKWGEADTIVQRITVLDNQPPWANCVDTIVVDLDATGTASIDSSYINNNSGDNCSVLKNIHIIKNIATDAGTSVTATTAATDVCSSGETGIKEKAVDGNTDGIFDNCSSYLSTLYDQPYWYVKLAGVEKRIYGIRIFNTDRGAPLTNFRVQVYSNLPPTHPLAQLRFDSLYSGPPVDGDVYFSIPNGVLGLHVQIKSEENNVQLGLAEVEVYGAAQNGDASELTFGCSDVRYTGTPNNFDPVSVLMRVVDQKNNLATCWSNVVVRDVTPPQVIPTNATVYLDQNGQVNVLGSQLLSASSDICGIDSSWVVPSAFDCSDVGSQPVRLWVRDVNGNPGSQSASVIVRDTIKPTIIPANNIELPLGPDGFYVIDPARDLISRVSDNCTDSVNLVYSSNPDTVFCENRGPLTVALSVTDENGNTRVQNVSANVVDLLPPTAVLSAYTLTVGSDGIDTLFFSDLIADSLIQDNCGTIGRKWIMYNQTNGWCLVGNEGSGAVTAYSNIASSVNNYGASSTAYSGTNLNNLHDNATANNLNDVYISDANTGTRSVYYYFPTSYQFNRSNIIWHRQTITGGGIPATPTGYQRGSSNVSEPAYTGYRLDNLNDGAISTSTADAYVTNGTTENNGAMNIYLDFGSTINVTQVIINWTGFIDLSGDHDAYSPDGVRVYRRATGGGGSWQRIASQTLDGDNTLIQTSDFSVDANTRYLRIEFWETTRFYQSSGGYAGRQDGFEPRIGIQEITVYTPDATLNCEIPTTNNLYYLNSSSNWVSLGSFGTSAPTTPNTLTFGPITTNAFRVDMTTSPNRRVGIREWQVEGRPVISNPACTTYPCDSVNRTTRVWLKWEDEALNADSVQTTVDIIPYFRTTDIQIADCAVSGEVFSPTIEGRVMPGRTYTYNWSTLDQPAGGHPYTSPFDNGGGNYSTTSTLEAPMVQNRTLWNGTDVIISGYYLVNFKITDDHGCSSDFDYGFTWRSDNGGGADSEKTDSVCIGEVKRYQATVPPSNSYWDSITYEWYNDPQVTLTPGTGGIYDDWAEFTFPTAGTYEFGYTQTGYQRNISYGPYTADGTNRSCSGTYPCRIVARTNPNILDPTVYTSNQTFPAGTVYVRTYVNAGWYQCLEGVNYTGTVYDVATPVLQPTSDVCVLDTVWYHTTTEYDHYAWSWSNGRRLSGGNWNDDSIQIIWNSYPDVPTVKVIGYNQLDCADSTTITLSYDGSGSPVLDCSGLDVTHINTANACYYTFQNLPPPLMTDDCHDRIANYSNDFNGGTNAAGRYDVGTTTVTWTATDYNGNTGSCSHTVTVTDNEPPRFTKYPTDTTLVANDDCEHFMLGTGKDVSGTDNCDANVVTALADIDYYDDGGGTLWDVTGVTTLNDVANEHAFPEGVSRVRWIISDNVATGENRDTTNFLVIVVDRTPPVWSPLPDITLPNSPDSCASNINISYPDTSAYCSDNCSAPENIRINFVRRSDGLAFTAPFPIDTTIVTWEALDDAMPANKSLQTQRVIVTDVEPPRLQTLNDSTITACQVNGHRLMIPHADDNCEVDSLIVTLVDTETTGANYGFADTITIEGFNPYGDGYTRVVAPALEDSTDYTVSWIAIDHSGLRDTIENALRVEVQPSFAVDSIFTTDLTCGGTASGEIIVNGVVAENGATVLYSRDGGSNWQEENRFTGLSGGDYGVIVSVNGCSSTLETVTIYEPASYNLDGALTQPYCEQGADGEIAVIMTGGAPAQQQFTGTAATVDNYAQIQGSEKGMIEAWVYLDADNLGTTIISKGTSYSLGIDANGMFSFVANGTSRSSTGTKVKGTNDKPKLERWYHVAASWNPDSCVILVNGYNMGAFAGVITPFVTNTGDLLIGDGFSGMIREVRVWNEDYATVRAQACLGIDPGKKKVGGGESYLGGCWPLTDGLASSVNKRAGGNEASVPGNWFTTLPQPGTYLWSKPGGWSNDSINISGLKSGTYTLTFRDNYGCPQAGSGLQRNFYLMATDNEAPYITPKADVIMPADSGDCIHHIVELDTLSLLPEVINLDGHNCTWTTVWDVYSFSTETGMIGASTLVGYDLALGRNLITVHVIQNGLENTSSFNVYIEDEEAPDAHARALTDLYLNSDVGNGHVTIYASELNDPANTQDNCTQPDLLRFRISLDSITWDDSIFIDCDALVTPKKISLMVIDEADNFANTNAISVMAIDSTRPVFLQPPRTYYGNCSTNDTLNIGYVEGIDGLVLTPWVDFGDNCNIDSFAYRIDNIDYPQFSYPATPGEYHGSTTPDASNHRYYQGTSEITFIVYDRSGNASVPTVMIRAEVLPMPNPGSVGGD